jgi:hypothetical protein
MCAVPTPRSCIHSVLPRCAAGFAAAFCCRGASAAAAGDAFSSRFSFQGGLAPVVMVSGSGAVVPWRCPIDSFTGDEDVPQVLLGGTAGWYCWYPLPAHAQNRDGA